jgi:type IV pilus assembly protein PilX
MLRVAHHSVVRPKQKGAVLVIGLLLLLILTIIGVTAMQMSRVQERMAGNTRDLNLAFQASEAALRNGENMIFNQAYRPETCTTSPCNFWESGAMVGVENEPASWWHSYAIEYEEDGDHSSVTESLGELAEDPEFVVEWLGNVRGAGDSLTTGHGMPEGRDFYRVTARSSGGSGAANTVLQTTYAKKF